MNGRSSQAGFSLVEALISIAIMAVGCLAVITMLDTAFSAGQVSRDYTLGADLAADMLDTIRNQVMTQIGADPGRLESFDNDGTASIILDTANAAPTLDPGKAAYQRWADLIQKNLKNGRGIVTIIENDSSVAKNISVSVRVEWSGLRLGMLKRGVTLRTVLCPQAS
jgi:type IV pilus modification protein PilV